MTMDHTVTDRRDTLELEEVASRAPQDSAADESREAEGQGGPAKPDAGLPHRERLPDRRHGYTQKARVGGQKIYPEPETTPTAASARSSSTCTRKARPSGRS